MGGAAARLAGRRRRSLARRVVVPPRRRAAQTREFVSEVAFELRKVVWPTRQETMPHDLVIIDRGRARELDAVGCSHPRSISGSFGCCWVNKEFGQRDQALVCRARLFGLRASGQARAARRASRAPSMQERFGQVLVPTEEVVEMRGGQKRKTERKFFPGYVLVQIETHDEGGICASTTRAGTWSRKRRR